MDVLLSVRPNNALRAKEYLNTRVLGRQAPTLGDFIHPITLHC